MMLCGDISAQLLQKWSLAGAHHHFYAIISEITKKSQEFLLRICILQSGITETKLPKATGGNTNTLPNLWALWYDHIFPYPKIRWRSVSKYAKKHEKQLQMLF